MEPFNARTQRFEQRPLVATQSAVNYLFNMFPTRSIFAPENFTFSKVEILRQVDLVGFEKRRSLSRVRQTAFEIGDSSLIEVLGRFDPFVLDLRNDFVRQEAQDR